MECIFKIYIGVVLLLSEVTKVFSTNNKESNQDSVVEEVSVVELYEGSLQNLD